MDEMTTEEKEELKKAEEVIQFHLDQIREKNSALKMALLTIEREGLYKENYRSMREYLREKHGIYQKDLNEIFKEELKQKERIRKGETENESNCSQSFGQIETTPMGVNLGGKN